jgi:rRNA processing protein Krr1/Pno1
MISPCEPSMSIKSFISLLSARVVRCRTLESADVAANVLSGSNIKRIVSEAGGPENSAEAVKFPNRDSDSTTIRIEGTDLVVAKIAAALEKFVSEKENQVTETLEVPTGKHRMLIGRGGDIKRGLESQFKVQIEIPKNGSGRTGVKISGGIEGVAKAKAHISDMVKEQGGETVMVPKSVHHTIAQGGNFFWTLKNDHGVTVDHGGKKPPPRPEPPTSHARTNGAPPPLITDEPDANAHSWNLVVAEIPDTGSETIPWILSGPSPEKVAAAKAHLETALESSSQPSATGYLRLPSPKSHRLVIGPGGRNINAIRRKTGCNIQVPRAGNDDRDGTIVITGPTEGCEEAKAMILAAVRNGDSH